MSVGVDELIDDAQHDDVTKAVPSSPFGYMPDGSPAEHDDDTLSEADAPLDESDEFEDAMTGARHEDSVLFTLDALAKNPEPAGPDPTDSDEEDTSLFEPSFVSRALAQVESERAPRVPPSPFSAQAAPPVSFPAAPAQGQVGGAPLDPVAFGGLPPQSLAPPSLPSAAPPQKKSSSAWIFILLFLIVLAAAGAAAFYFKQPAVLFERLQ